jgi:hypothetical protein
MHQDFGERLAEEPLMSTTSDLPDIPTRGPARPGPYVLSGVLLAIAIVMPLIVPIYASADPPFAGMPFFYWYQMLWVPIDAALIGICYFVMTREDGRRRRDARRDQEVEAGNGLADGEGTRP